MSNNSGHSIGLSPTEIIDKAIALAESGDSSGVLSEAFTKALKAIRGQDESYYTLNVKPQLKALKSAKPPITVSDIDRLTKPAKKTKPRFSSKQDDSGESSRQGKTEILIDLVSRWATVFCDESGKAYATFPVALIDTETGEASPPHYETWPLESKQFRGKVGRKFLTEYGVVPGETAIKEAIEILTVDAEDMPPKPVYLRCAPIPNEKSRGVYIDLANDKWQVVEITSGGWCVIQSVDCLVKFRRVQHSKPLPLPDREGDVSAIWKHINIQGDDNQLLVLAWLLECMRIDTPYPVLELIAGQGSAKSTTQERLRQLIDPNAVPLRMEPRSNQDLSVSALGNHMICLNNLSRLNKSTQDFMCSVSTGGGDATRRLHTTEDEAAWDTKRPIVMNGINQLVTAPDLADRTVCIELHKILNYVDEASLVSAWAQDYPKILGGLYELMANTLRDLPTVKLARLPRMGDFAKMGVAMCAAIKSKHSFVDVFNDNRDRVVARGVESSPVALALVSYIRAERLFEGTATDLMKNLTVDAYQPKYYDRQAWPKTARGLGEALRRLAPSLAVYGIDVQQRKGRSRSVIYTIEKINKDTDKPESF